MYKTGKDYPDVCMAYSEAAVMAGLYWNIICNCDKRPEEAENSRVFLHNKTMHYLESVRASRNELLTDTDSLLLLKQQRAVLFNKWGVSNLLAIDNSDTNNIVINDGFY